MSLRLLSADRGLARGWAEASPSATARHRHALDSSRTNIQLRASFRRWPEPQHVNPIIVAGRPLPAELKSYSVRSYPKRMPKAARTVRMREGSALYLPRGYWHDTVVQGDSLAVCFAVKPQIWAGVLLDVLRRRLIQDPGWRQGVFGLAGDARRRAAIERCLARLLPPFAEAADLSEGKLEALPSRKTP